MRGVLTLDLATRTGFAHWSPGEARPASGCQIMPKTGPQVGRFLVVYRDWLLEMLAVARPGTVIFEAPWVGPNTHQDTARKLMSLAGVTEMVCQDVGDIRCMEAHNQTVRKHFLGRANLPRAELKARVIEECRKRGWDPGNDDEADALALLDYGCHALRFQPPWMGGDLFAQKAADLGAAEMAARGIA